ncbi:hypothetical protein DEAC_c41660 [Desulfosporosinus acididurans]|uniref:Uncharacterized protein n=1 Tax=Desulfosporosinus acididurans TaxID=476652 RepID=A0A0J1FKK3_9FIRM|nr:hypothetical protein [Desulfosporosinus acididurans]KLU63937.1 hypothetical protein DEAC_c41660 [Desulfosporosinus acididurans]
MDNFKIINNFLNDLKENKIHFRLNKIRSESITIEVAVPRQRWEIDFMEDGTINIEKFFSDGTIYADDELKLLFNEFPDNESDYLPTSLMEGDNKPNNVRPMFEKAEVITAMNTILNEREKNIIIDSWGINSKLLRPEEVYSKYNTTNKEMRVIQRRVINYIILNRK